MKETVVYLIRHTRVENPKDICYGRLPGFGLSEEGVSQAEKLSDFFRKYKIEKIYTSPLLRARQTAKIISKGKIPIYVRKSLTEIDCHSVEGKPMKEAISLRSKTGTKNDIFPDEKYLDVQKRMANQITKIINYNMGKKIIIVSHADPIICAKLYFLKKPLENIEKIPLINGSATILTFNDKLECTKVDYKNLSGAKRDF